MKEKVILLWCEKCQTFSKVWSLRCLACGESRNFDKNIVIPKNNKVTTSRKRKGFSKQNFYNNVTFDQLLNKW
jgi:hypothetical protein